MNNLSKELKVISQETYKLIDELLSFEDKLKERRLFEAMRYSCLSEGKMLRPFLTVTCSNLFKVDSKFSLRVAAAIELIHVFSLIHDDLPALDNDDFRRGKPSCHKKFDEATAILAGDALLAMAFEIVSSPKTHPNAEVRCRILELLSKAVGPSGMVGGQMMDMCFDGPLNKPDIVKLQKMKTGALFCFSCEVGAVLGGASAMEQKCLRTYAENFGLAFQIIDDLKDFKEDEQQDQDKPTFINLMGVEESKIEAEKLMNESIYVLKDLAPKNVTSLKSLSEQLLLEIRK